MEKQKEALTDLITTAIARCSVLRESGETVDEAAVIADFLVERGVIVPPCKVGDTIYICRYGTIRKETVEKIECSNAFMSLAFNWRGMAYEWVSDRDFGKTFFLTQEEAEKALKEAQA